MILDYCGRKRSQFKVSIKQHFPIDIRTSYHPIHHYWNKAHFLLLSLTNFRKKNFTGSEYSQKPIQGISFVNSIIVHIPSGTAVAQWLRCCATNRKVAGSIPASVSGFFIDIKSFRSHYGLEVYSASTRNEYQKYFLGVKAAGA